MSRGLFRMLFSLPCKRDRHRFEMKFPPNFYVCRDCGEPGFAVPEED